MHTETTSMNSMSTVQDKLSMTGFKYLQHLKWKAAAIQGKF